MNNRPTLVVELSVLCCYLDFGEASRKLHPGTLHDLHIAFVDCATAATNNRRSIHARQADDSIAAYFTSSEPLDYDHAESAVRAGLAMLQWTRNRGLLIRISVVTDFYWPPVSEDKTAQIIAKAETFTAAVPIDRLFVDGYTRERTQATFEFANREIIHPKGRLPQDIWEVLRVFHKPSTSTAASSAASLLSRPLDERLTHDLAATSEQRPAAYRFAVLDHRLDVLPEPFDVADVDTAKDLWTELVRKLRDLEGRLGRSNSPKQTRANVKDVLDALTAFDEIRPGVLLARVRIMEADRTTYDTPEGRLELFDDAISAFDSALGIVRDLLATFPAVRRIEAERLALDLDRNAEAIPTIQSSMQEVQAAAAQSGAITGAATVALSQNDTAIADAVDPLLRNTLVADKALVVRNLLGAAAGKLWVELGEASGLAWSGVKEGLGPAGKVAPYVALITFAGLVAGPAGVLGSVVHSFAPLSRAFGLFATKRADIADVIDGEAPTAPSKSRATRKNAVRRKGASARPRR